MKNANTLSHSVVLASLMTFSAILLTGPKAFSWADMGHEIVGAVAEEENLRPATKDFVRGILGVEPLEVAAIWPDHVRDDERFGHKNAPPLPILDDNHNFADYHFCEIPTGFTYATRPNKDAKDCYGAITGAESILKDESGKYTKAEKLIAIRYLIHIVGDISQPLHVGNGFDIGANVCQVMWQKSPTATPVQMNMHTFWDDTLIQYLGSTYAITDPDPKKSKKAAIYLDDYMATINVKHADMMNEDTKAKVATGTLADWLQEAQALRESGVYPDDPAAMANVPKGQEYKNRPYCLWFTDQVNSVLAPGVSIDKTKIPTIGADYANKYSAIAEMQLVKSGLRLASVLDSIADDVARQHRAFGKITDVQQEKILSRVQKTFTNKVPAAPAPGQ